MANTPVRAVVSGGGESGWTSSTVEKGQPRLCDVALCHGTWAVDAQNEDANRSADCVYVISDRIGISP